MLGVAGAHWRDHQHADIREATLDQTPADQPIILMHLREDISLRSHTFACWRLGIRLPYK
jgi:hypothetical protein